MGGVAGGPGDRGDDLTDRCGFGAQFVPVAAATQVDRFGDAQPPLRLADFFFRDADLGVEVRLRLRCRGFREIRADRGGRRDELAGDGTSDDVPEPGIVTQGADADGEGERSVVYVVAHAQRGSIERANQHCTRHTEKTRARRGRVQMLQPSVAGPRAVFAFYLLPCLHEA